MEFFTDNVSVTTTATELVGAVSFDRRVLVSAFGEVKLGLDDTTLDFAMFNGNRQEIPLPAGQSLWAKTDSGSAPVHLFVGR